MQQKECPPLGNIGNGAADRTALVLSSHLGAFGGWRERQRGRRGTPVLSGAQEAEQVEEGGTQPFLSVIHASAQTVILENGLRHRASCIHGWLVHHHNCPEDRQPLEVTLLRPLFRYMRNDLSRLQIRCRNREQGCEMVCSLESVDRHERECEYGLVACTNTGCPMQVERRTLEAHLSVCEFRSRECPNGCGYTILSCDDTQHSCVAELRTELELLRSEMICKVEEVRHEMESRLDSQRRHMVQKESLLKNEVEELKGQLSRVMSDVRALMGAERLHRQEMEQAELEKRELLELLKSLQREGHSPATPPPHAVTEGLRKASSARSLTLDCIKRKSREVTVI
ncbi:hypothetical protein AGOR_G00112940 [Albula goreensis]|uniref:TRAF-type domain-containing protein n=1 Tax=Albula goreensis TaxID=1534307 RepID=A0A8T3DGS2_9TELE|nr:hypothetical protein AGOR_G00112940 [Albula goreensis]